MDRLNIRGIAAAVIEALTRLADRHERSVEAEARYALTEYTQRHTGQVGRAARLTAVAERLQLLLREVNRVPGRGPVHVSHIAQAIGETHGAPAEEWIAGESEPSFQQLAAVAAHAGVCPPWLQHGEGKMFPVEYARVPSGAGDALQWFLAPIFDGAKIGKIHLVRSKSQAGELAIIKETEDRRSIVFHTPYHVSTEIGGGGRSQLGDLSNAFRILYKFWVKDREGLLVKSYLLPEKEFDLLLSGKAQPLAFMAGQNESAWWEDWWDAKMFRDQEPDHYWPDYRKLCEMIYSDVQNDEHDRAVRDSIVSLNHPALRKSLGESGDQAA